MQWHRQGFRYYWRWKSHRRRRSRIDPEIRDLIRRMCRVDPMWVPRIHGELLKFGIDVSEATVSKSMIRRRGPPSQNWRTFLKNHSKEHIAPNIVTIPEATFSILFVLIIFSHDRRRILQFNVAEYPTAAWTTRQLAEACGIEETPRYLIRDRGTVSMTRRSTDRRQRSRSRKLPSHLSHRCRIPMSNE